MSRILTCDVLILGAGLAGLRAARSALEARPTARVTVASLRSGPTGSSFANTNNALGILVPESDAARRALCREVLDLAAPGYVDPGLVRLLADEAEKRFAELSQLAPDLDRHPSGGLRSHPACFSPDSRAYVFRDLPGLYHRFRHLLADLGCTFLPGMEARGLLTDQDPEGTRTVLGAALADQRGEPVVVHAPAVVMALGGPAPLYASDMSGPANTGLSYGLMAEAGARLENTPYLQFMWTDERSRAFCSPARLLAPGSLVRTRTGQVVRPEEALPADLAEALPGLLLERNRHCPAAYQRPDAVLDQWLAAQRDRNGWVHVKPPDQDWLQISPLAHAGNGGAVIDEHARTTVRGLFAAGECATGMHGANRLGGAMILATQVFGARAGAFAARLAEERDQTPLPDTILRAIQDKAALWSAPPRRNQALLRLRLAMQDQAVLLPGSGLPDLVERLTHLAQSAPERVLELTAKSALAVAAPMLQWLRGSGRGRPPKPGYAPLPSPSPSPRSHP